jgi:hypothetical protein
MVGWARVLLARRRVKRLHEPCWPRCMFLPLVWWFCGGELLKELNGSAAMIGGLDGQATRSVKGGTPRLSVG